MEEVILAGLLAALRSPVIRGEIAALFWDILRRRDSDPAYAAKVDAVVALAKAARTEEAKDAANVALHELLLSG